ncbi:MAG: hypothetical protein NT080_00800 [Spirochaetes bacterium]|nr:hypothetical protein [Spirochaetota bacterium]
MKRSVSFVMIAAMAVSSVAAELARPITMSPLPVFTPEVELFPSFSSAIDGWQGLDQAGAPLFAHGLETSAAFDFVSSPRVVVSGFSREIFGFKANPDGPFMFRSRDLVTALGLRAWFLAGPVVLGASYRHDCKHDIYEDFGRDLVHDAFGAAVRQAKPFRFDAIGGRGSADAALEFEANVPPLFQQASFDVDRFRFSAEALAVPVLFGTTLRLSAEGRISAIGRSGSAGVAVPDGISWDWRLAAGIEAVGEAGTVRLYASIERITDTWRNAAPEPVLVPAAGLTFAFGEGFTRRNP